MVFADVGIDLAGAEAADADAVIFAVETKVREEERFKDKEIHKISVKEAIKNAEKAIKDALGE